MQLDEAFGEEFVATQERNTFFDVYGPFDIQQVDRCVTRGQPQMWAAYKDAEGLKKAIGCYMFCLDNGKTVRPWYVGMTVAKDGFGSEAFQPHKIQIYNEVLGNRRGKPVMFLFPLMTPDGEFSRASVTKKKLIQWLERYLMMTAFARNPEISNIRDMHNLRNVEVLGVLGKRRGRPHTEVGDVRRALFGGPERLDE